ncbi:glycosyltransferase, partial [Photobacterium frigidiphilum]|uniref:glycosyltransferase family 2 protein n=1 Tax=Photobacterium frigidiphilum TaxID=264736 RepID=UPI003D097557
MSAIKLSIIIPCYNASKYLPNLLDSIISQLDEHVEIIMIDDCSDDETLIVIDRYCKGIKNFSVIKNQVNQGIGASRNLGLQFSKGKYIWFIDSDDLLPQKAISHILKNIDTCSCDIQCYSHTLIDTLKNNNSEVQPPVGVYDEVSFIELVLKKKMSFHLWNKIFSRESIGDALADENISVLVDMNFILRMIENRTFTLVVIPNSIY